ncbi:hypothetical protein DdX_15119 [Ditylenchus destructor]|uniref:Uncharacterized protein n=1 Tax=Ditylenchus destructor TaxID=166010 RepID=A0AAD4MRI8_9BILA|nr:hypothetical protein DdX_15119 [Ditylenchus destructor]
MDTLLQQRPIIILINTGRNVHQHMAQIYETGDKVYGVSIGQKTKREGEDCEASLLKLFSNQDGEFIPSLMNDRKQEYTSHVLNSWRSYNAQLFNARDTGLIELEYKALGFRRLIKLYEGMKSLL